VVVVVLIVVVAVVVVVVVGVAVVVVVEVVAVVVVVVAAVLAKVPDWSTSSGRPVGTATTAQSRYAFDVLYLLCRVPNAQHHALMLAGSRG
jgi:hypothetical protein